jgi:regulator of sigma D
MKCHEIDQLISRLLKHRRKIVQTHRRLARVEAEKTRNGDLLAENESLKTQLAEVKESVRQYLIRHRASRADTETKELQRLAMLRAEAEKHNIELYAFVLSQLRQFLDGRYDVDEESARKSVINAAAMLRSLDRKSPSHP